MNRIFASSSSPRRGARTMREPLAGHKIEHVKIPVHARKLLVFKDEENKQQLERDAGKHITVESPPIGDESPQDPLNKTKKQGSQILEWMPTLKVTMPGIASTMSPEQLLSYSPEITLQLALPQQIAIHLGDHFPECCLILDENGHYVPSVADVNHPMTARLIDSHLKQQSPCTQHPLVASLIDSLIDSNRSQEPPGDQYTLSGSLIDFS